MADLDEKKSVDTGSSPTGVHTSTSAVPAATRYDPSKESKWTRIGLNAESFKRAPGSAWADDGAGEAPMLQQTLSNRHLQMIAVGGSIGTGLFIGTGGALSSGGPLGMLIAWGIMGMMLLATMQAMGEMAILYPVSGGFYTLTSRFVDPSWGFAMGWNYVLQWAVVLPLELTAAAITVEYWTTSVNVAIWITIFYLAIIFINVFGTIGYGEEEFWSSCLKLLVVVGFIFIAIVCNCGGGPSKGAYSEYVGGRYWQNPGPLANGFKGVCSVFVTAAFSFAGTELVGLAATESKDPAKRLPQAIKGTFWRISVVYLLSILMIGLLIPFNDPALVGGAYDANVSPFVIVIDNAGIPGLNHVVNATITISVLSIGLSCVYGGSRTLTALAETGYAPKIFAYVDKAGRPLWSTIFILAFGPIAYVNLSATSGTIVFNWLLALSGLSTLFTWLSINVSHIRFRQAWKAGGHSIDELPYRAHFGVWGSYFAAFIIILVLIAQFFVALSPLDGSPPSAETFFMAYLALPVVLACYAAGLIWKGRDPAVPFTLKTMFTGFNLRRAGPRRLADIDLVTGRRFFASAEELNAIRAERANQPFYKRVYNLLF